MGLIEQLEAAKKAGEERISEIDTEIKELRAEKSRIRAAMGVKAAAPEIPEVVTVPYPVPYPVPMPQPKWPFRPIRPYEVEPWDNRPFWHWGETKRLGVTEIKMLASGSGA